MFCLNEQVNLKAYIPKSTGHRLVVGKSYYLYLPPENLVAIVVIKNNVLVAMDRVLPQVVVTKNIN